MQIIAPKKDEKQLKLSFGMKKKKERNEIGRFVTKRSRFVTFLKQIVNKNAVLN
ncbi:hypothetical protein D3C80_357120 [compost metagenome]